MHSSVLLTLNLTGLAVFSFLFVVLALVALFASRRSGLPGLVDSTPFAALLFVSGALAALAWGFSGQSLAFIDVVAQALVSEAGILRHLTGAVWFLAMVTATGVTVFQTPRMLSMVGRCLQRLASRTNAVSLNA